MSGGLDRGRSRFRPASLDALNFLLADVRGALGPYLNVFLVTRRHWSQSEVGLVTAVGGWLGLAVQTPVGAAIDATRMKRGAIVFALAVLAAGALCIYIAPRFWPVLVANTLIAIVGDVFGPAVAALTLGLVRQQALARRLGRNAASIMLGTSPSLRWRVPSDGFFRSGPCSCSSQSSPYWRRPERR